MSDPSAAASDLPASGLPTSGTPTDECERTLAAVRAAHAPAHSPISGPRLAREVCRRLSCETGWPIRFVPDTDAERRIAPGHDRLPTAWQSDLRDGHHRTGWLRIDQPTGRRRDDSFLHACRVAEALVPTLSIVLAEPCSTETVLDELPADADDESVPAVIDRVLENLLRLTGLRSAGFFLRSRDGLRMTLQAERHRDGQAIPRPERSVPDSPFDAAAVAGQRSLVRREWSDLPPELWQVGDDWLPESCQLGICQPVATSHQPSDVLGTLWVFDRRARRLPRRELQIIESVAARLGQVLEKAVLFQESAERQRLTDDLLAASGNTPDEISHVVLGDGRYEIAARCLAHSSVGGDLCEILVDGDPGAEQAILGLGDASGHSLPATLVMATVRGALRALSLDEAIRFESDAIMARLNKALVGVAQSHQFMTMVAGHLDAAAGHLTFTNAGHPLPVFVRTMGEAGGDEVTVETPNSHGMLLGVFEDAGYERQTLDLRSGDVLAIYTDGLAEAAGPDGRLFKTDGVVDSVVAHRDRSAAEICDRLWRDVERHMDGVPCDDDRSVLVLKVN